MMSHYASSHNVLFKVTVPKRTGRKRKRGSNGPWEGDVEETHQKDGAASTTNFRSKAKLDEARIVRRKLQDNVDRYQAEVVGVIKHTHRYRGMVDFNYSMKNNEFMNNFTETLMSKDRKVFTAPCIPSRPLMLICSIQIPTIRPQTRHGFDQESRDHCTATHDPDHSSDLLPLLPKSLRQSNRWSRRYHGDGQHHSQGPVCRSFHRHSPPNSSRTNRAPKRTRPHVR